MSHQLHTILWLAPDTIDPTRLVLITRPHRLLLDGVIGRGTDITLCSGVTADGATINPRRRTISRNKAAITKALRDDVGILDVTHLRGSTYVDHGALGLDNRRG